MIIDVDAHGEPPPAVLESARERAGLEALDVGETTLRFIAGDLLETMPA